MAAVVVMQCSNPVSMLTWSLGVGRASERILSKNLLVGFVTGNKQSFRPDIKC